MLLVAVHSGTDEKILSPQTPRIPAPATSGAATRRSRRFHNCSGVTERARNAGSLGPGRVDATSSLDRIVKYGRTLLSMRHARALTYFDQYFDGQYIWRPSVTFHR